MLVSSKWRDYELLDCSGGERLERWGDFTLIRPDPQVIWNSEKAHGAWTAADARYSSKSGKGVWESAGLPENWEIGYGKLRFLIRPTGFKHTGLFPEQAVNWDFITETILSAGRPVSMLNLFAYTGGATLAAAAAGARVCHVDAARGMIAWARDNARVSGLENAPIRWIVDDCLKFLEREIKRGKKYDVIVMDPPSYGRGPNGETWKLENDLWRLVSRASEALSENPQLFIINSYTTGLSPATLTYVARSIISKKFGGTCTASELGLPVSSSGQVLPCGSTMRWVS